MSTIIKNLILNYIELYVILSFDGRQLSVDRSQKARNLKNFWQVTICWILFPAREKLDMLPSAAGCQKGFLEVVSWDNPVPKTNSTDVKCDSFLCTKGFDLSILTGAATTSVTLIRELNVFTLECCTGDLQGRLCLLNQRKIFPSTW